MISKDNVNSHIDSHDWNVFHSVNIFSQMDGIFPSVLYDLIEMGLFKPSSMIL